MFSTLRPAGFCLALLVFLSCFSGSAAAQQQYATQVVSYVQGPLGTGLTNPSSILGGPEPSNFQGVLSLLEGGQVTVGFGVTIVDGPGADFTVFENGFEFPGGSGQVFAETVYVEVSSNGLDFARFPTSYNGPSVPHMPFDTTPMGSYAGFAGGTPVLADVAGNMVDPGDPAVSGGDAFDLAALAGDPLVLSGLVDLSSINFVRLIDVVAGANTDSFGNAVYDDFGVANDSADIDAIAVLNHSGNQSLLSPDISIGYDGFGRLEVVISDPGGLSALDPASFVLSGNFIPLGPSSLATYFFISSVQANALTLTTNFGVIGSSLPTLILGVSISNLSGKRVSAQFPVQP